MTLIYNGRCAGLSFLKMDGYCGGFFRMRKKFIVIALRSSAVFKWCKIVKIILLKNSFSIPSKNLVTNN